VIEVELEKYEILPSTELGTDLGHTSPLTWSLRGDSNS
jgi:hypothetical protein